MLFILAKIALLVILLSLYYAVTAAMGEPFMSGFWDFMFADYIAVYDVHIAGRWPGWTHPPVLVIVIALAIAVVPGVVKLITLIASIIIAVFVARLGFLLTGADGAPLPTPELGSYALLAAGWLLFAAAIGDRSLFNWYRARRLGVR